MKTPLLLILIIMILPSLSFAFLTPSGGTAEYITNYTSPSQEGTEVSSAGGHIHVMNIEATQQTPYWKGYVGNITGRFVLSDGINYLFDWQLENPRGKIYASRHEEILWSELSCAEIEELEDEDAFLGLDANRTFSITRTFSNFMHNSFYSFFQGFTANSCPSAHLNIYGEEASDDFQEIVLSDSSSRLIYVGIIRSNTTGFNNETYDYQLILPESQEALLTPYYFYLELE